MTVRMETEFVSGLPIRKKMSDSRTQANGSLVGGNAMEGTGNATADTVRGLTRSGLSFAAPNVSGSRQLARKTTKTMGEWKANTDINRTAHSSTPQFLGTQSGSYANPHTARRASGVTPLTYTNSSRKRVQSPESATRQVQTKRQRELADVRQKQKDLANRQHRYATRRGEANKQRAAELQKSEEE